MTQEILVKCLSTEDKDAICALYNEKRANLKELAKIYGVSPRTINRVLIERDIATPVPRIKGEAYQAMQILKEFNVEVKNLREVLGNSTQVSRKVTESEVKEYLKGLNLEDAVQMLWMLAFNLRLEHDMVLAERNNLDRKIRELSKPVFVEDISRVPGIKPAIKASVTGEPAKFDLVRQVNKQFTQQLPLLQSNNVN